MNRKIVGYITFDHPSTPQKIPFYEGQNIIGRSHIKASIYIREKTISEQHCTIFTKQGKLFIMDLGSRNGVFTRQFQSRLLAKQPLEITPGITQFRISEVKCKIQLGEHWNQNNQRQQQSQKQQQRKQQMKELAHKNLQQQDTKFDQIHSKTQYPQQRIQQQKIKHKIAQKSSKPPRSSKQVRFTNGQQNERHASVPPVAQNNQVQDDKNKKRSESNDTRPKGSKKNKKGKQNKKRQPIQAERRSKRIIHEMNVMISCFRPTFVPNSRIKIVQDLKSDFDILLMGEQYRKTVKFYLAILNGAPIVSYQWLIKSENAFRILPYEKYELKQDANIIKSSLQKVREGFKVFDGIIFNFPNDPKQYHLTAQNISLLIEKGGGKYMRSIAKSKAGNFKCILPKQPKKEDIEKCKKVTNQVYTIELVLDSIFHQELNLQAHRL